MSESKINSDEKIGKVLDLLETFYLEFKRTTAEIRDDFDKKLHSQGYELKSEMADLRTELKSDMADLRTELKSEIAEFRQEVNTRFDKIEDLVQQHEVEIKTIKAAK